ncbi:MAG: hypothetical protein Q4F49_00210 [Pseudoxanthomonas suwonensis]|nr:hypothetical protein [Pseudoxanthomonas suwonensis]
MSHQPSGSGGKGGILAILVVLVILVLGLYFLVFQRDGATAPDNGGGDVEINIGDGQPAPPPSESN